MHLFYRNNELAGYCAVLHCLSLSGMDGFYGPRRKVTILGYGSVSKGAIRALNGRGFNFIHTYTHRKTHLVAEKNPDVYFGNYHHTENGEIYVQESDLSHRTILEALCDSDIIVNGILQDPNNPTMFLREGDVKHLKPGTILIDVSCDRGMAFCFARPTTFDIPYVNLERNIRYYSVDHAPSYLWQASSREISAVVLSQIEKLAMGPVGWDSDETLKKATEIRQGRIANPTILEFQRRKPQFPHERELGAFFSDDSHPN
jgi:N5-(carboxyethyl)ornithine synthase